MGCPGSRIRKVVICGSVYYWYVQTEPQTSFKAGKYITNFQTRHYGMKNYIFHFKLANEKKGIKLRFTQIAVTEICVIRNCIHFVNLGVFIL